MKHQIEKKTDIPVSKQVLLVSGGGLLDPFQTVSFYCAGTDTSPFFLFSKMLIDQPNAPSAYFDTLPGTLLQLTTFNVTFIICVI